VRLHSAQAGFRPGYDKTSPFTSTKLLQAAAEAHRNYPSNDTMNAKRILEPVPEDQKARVPESQRGKVRVRATVRAVAEGSRSGGAVGMCCAISSVSCLEERVSGVLGSVVGAMPPWNHVTGGVLDPRSRVVAYSCP
jgi:hypothetical protein